VIEAEQPTRKTRRGKGRSDLMDAHLAVLFALQRCSLCNATTPSCPPHARMETARHCGSCYAPARS